MSKLDMGLYPNLTYLAWLKVHRHTDSNYGVKACEVMCRSKITLKLTRLGCSKPSVHGDKNGVFEMLILSDLSGRFSEIVIVWRV